MCDTQFVSAFKHRFSSGNLDVGLHKDIKIPEDINDDLLDSAHFLERLNLNLNSMEEISKRRNTL